MASGQVFVTVGTTKFDQLISTISTSPVINVLKSKGYTKIKMQIGNGDIPKCGQIPGMQLDYYRFKTSIMEDIQEANLVVSHAGAGSCLEVLEARKPLVVVINQQLMDNHQLELAEQLQADDHLFYSSCSNLGTTLELMDLNKLKPFPAGNGKDFVDFLDGMLGFNKLR